MTAMTNPEHLEHLAGIKYFDLPKNEDSASSVVYWVFRGPTANPVPTANPAAKTDRMASRPGCGCGPPVARWPAPIRTAPISGRDINCQPVRMNPTQPECGVSLLYMGAFRAGERIARGAQEVGPPARAMRSFWVDLEVSGDGQVG